MNTGTSLELSEMYLEDIKKSPIFTQVADTLLEFRTQIHIALHEYRLSEKEAREMCQDYGKNLPGFYFRGAENLVEMMDKNPDRVTSQFLSPLWRFLKIARDLGYNKEECDIIESRVMILIDKKSS